MHSCMSKFLHVHASPSLNAQMTIYALYAFFPTRVYTHARNVYFLTNLASLLIAISTDLGSPEYKIKYIFCILFYNYKSLLDNQQPFINIERC